MKCTTLQHTREAFLKQLDITIHRSQSIMQARHGINNLSQNEIKLLEWHKTRYAAANKLKQAILKYEYE